MQRLFKMFRSNTIENTRREADAPNIIKPANPFVAIGDIHGRSDLLDKLVQEIAVEQQEKVVFLGDYIDRGPDSAGTLKRLFEMTQKRPTQIVCLMGNHEQMMLDFIDDPLGRGARWLHNGGIATLESFGIKDCQRTNTPDRVMELCDIFEKALSDPLQAWLRQLPRHWHSGNMWCVHAGMDPAKPPEAQKPETFLWGHKSFLSDARTDGICVVHGHTIVDTPVHAGSRIAVDTGAYKSGCLTAAHIGVDACAFSST
jgi:serine/threonine protein phosphatase 1